MARNTRGKTPPIKRPEAQNGAHPSAVGGYAAGSGARDTEGIGRDCASCTKLTQELTALKTDRASFEAKTEAAIRELLQDEIRADEAKLRSRYREQQELEIDALKTKAEEAAARERSDATNDALRIVLDAEQTAQEIQASAVGEATQTREAAQSEKDAADQYKLQVMAEADRKRAEILAQARRDAVAATEERESELQETETSLKAREAAARLYEQQIIVREEDLSVRQTELNLYRESYERRWKECSPARVRELELQMEGIQSIAETYRTQAQTAQTEVARLTGLLSGENGRSLSTILEELEQSKARCRHLADQLVNAPSSDELQALRQSETHSQVLRDETRTLRARLMESEARAGRVELSNREFQQTQAQVNGLRVLNDELRRELEQNTNALKGRSGERFPELKSLDSAPPVLREGRPIAASGLLEELVRFVRRYAASRPKSLFYSETTLRTFLAGMATSRIAILQGLSGTGKSSLPRVFAEATGGECVSVPVQSNWRDRHELLGYNNEFTRKFSETEFTKAVYRAGLPHEEDTIWLIVLDEMNLARVEYYFADFLSALEEPTPERRRVSLLSYDPSSVGESSPQFLDKGKLRIPENLWFVGTANQDESTFEITDKVYDRAQVLEFREREQGAANRTAVLPTRVTQSALQAAFAQALVDPRYALTETDELYLQRIDHFLHQRLDLTFGHRVEEQMRTFVAVFCAAGGRKDEAVDVQLARKILRKVEGRHDHHLAGVLTDLKDLMEANAPPGYGLMAHSMGLLDRKLKSVGGVIA